MLAEIITVGTAVAAAAGWAWKRYRDRRDKKKIYDFMLDSRAKNRKPFRSKEAISSDTNISTDRVIILCTKLCVQGKLIRNHKEKDSWKLSPTATH
jgi:hypothetical protein